MDYYEEKRREDSKEKVSCIQFLPLGLMASADAWCYTCVYRIQPQVRGLGIGKRAAYTTADRQQYTNTTV